MGFFSNKKEVNKKVSATTTSMPPAPSASSAAPTTNNVSVSNTGKLTPPPVPANPQLEEIKTEITSSSENKLNFENSSSNNENKDLSNTEKDFSIQSNNDSSLFDLTDLDINEPETDSSKTEKNENDDVDDIEVSNETAIDPDDDNLSKLSYRHSGINRNDDKDIYITTSQFKTLLSVIDSVKTKVKEASETHLRLTDIKSEEDIEYENLRKVFQFVEDKLYEVDGLIFEK